MTFELEKQQFDQHGFVIVRQLLAESEFTELKQNLDRYIRDVVPGLPDGDAFYQDRSRPVSRFATMNVWKCEHAQDGWKWRFAMPVGLSTTQLLGLMWNEFVNFEIRWNCSWSGETRAPAPEYSVLIRAANQLGASCFRQNSASSARHGPSFAS